MCRLEAEMVDISVGCINENTYGISCVHCGQCGRKFTMNGVDDSKVVSKKVKEYSNFLKSDLWKEINIKQIFAFKGEKQKDMVKYYCDLCDKEVNKYNEYTLPIAATWVNGEPCDLIRVGGFILCKECRSKIYKTIESILPKEKMQKLNEKALNIKMGKCDEQK